MKKSIGYRLKMVFCTVLLLVLTVNPVVAQALTIVIDPGHGGTDPGAVGQAGVREKDLNLDISQRLAVLLQAQGHDVVMTRDNDQYISLVTRTDVAAQVYADLFISIHNNASTNRSITGSQVLYYYNTSSDVPAVSAMAAQNSQNNKDLASSIQSNLLKTLGTVDRGLIVRNDLSVLRRATMPAVLVEVGFLSNSKEEQWLNQEDTKDKAAEAIFQGIQEYLDTRTTETSAFKDIGRHWSKDYVNLLSEKEIAKGSGDFFYPQRNITRAEVAALIVRALGLQPSPGATPFADVPPMHWAAAEIAVAKEYGLIGGYQDGTFRPEQQVKRSEMSKMLGEALSKHSESSDSIVTTSPDGPVTLSKEPLTTGFLALVQESSLLEEQSSAEQVFRDIAEHWAQPHILILAANGITGGYSDGTFRPEGKTTRGEMSAFIARLIEPSLRIR